MVLAALKVARPIHWVKNFALFAAILFTGRLLTPLYFHLVFWAFIAFSLITSATYIFNDLMDQKQDRLHPIKRFRPIASGDLPVWAAITELVALVVLAHIITAGLGHPLFTYSVWAYLLLQLLYSTFLKHIPTVDILVIASGFIIRVYAGAFVIDAHLSVWFLLCVISAALFLASGKRRAEINIIKKSGVTRKSLVRYQKELLNSYVTMFGNAAWMSWALFTFFESPKASLPVWLFLAELSQTTTINKLMMITIPVVIFGIMRYQSLIFEGRSEAPEKLFLTDKALVISVVIWTGLITWILYGGASANAI